MHDTMTSNVFNSLICFSLTRNLEMELSFSRIENYFKCRFKKAYTVRVTSYTRHNDAMSWSETQKHGFILLFKLQQLNTDTGSHESILILTSW